MMRASSFALVAVLFLAGCAIRLGGPKDHTFTATALSAADDADLAGVAAELRGVDPDVVLLSSPGDSAWFSAIADALGLVLSGPGPSGSAWLGFLAGEALGDTTIALPVVGGSHVVVHDALYQVENERYLDLLAMRVDPGDDARAVVRALLAYVATDVMHDAAVVLGVDVPDAALADSVSTLLSPAFADVRTCLSDGAAARATGMQLFYGPEFRMRCDSARVLEPDRRVVARLVVNR